MANRAQVVLTTVGPYAHYGLPLVAACAKAGTDYADLTGELMFGRNNIDLYHKQAADTGARIVLSCGFDSVPSDPNVDQVDRRAIEDGTGELCDTTLSAALLLADRDLRRLGCNISRRDAHCIQRRASPPTHRRPVHAEYGPRCRTRTGYQPDFPWRRGRDVAPELSGFWIGGFVQAPTTLELSGVATHYRTGPMAGGSATPKR